MAADIGKIRTIPRVWVLCQSARADLSQRKIDLCYGQSRFLFLEKMYANVFGDWLRLRQVLELGVHRSQNWK